MHEYNCVVRSGERGRKKNVLKVQGVNEAISLILKGAIAIWGTEFSGRFISLARYIPDNYSLH
jgi:hypothetical protein